MNDLTNSRRKLIKQVGLGIGLAVSGKLSAAAEIQGVDSCGG